MSTGKKVAVGVLAGAAVGAIVGVLFAPDKGSETRKKISTKTSDAVSGVKNKVAGVVDSISEKFQDGKEHVAEAIDKVKGKVEDFKKDGQKA